MSLERAERPGAALCVDGETRPRRGSSIDPVFAVRSAETSSSPSRRTFRPTDDARSMRVLALSSGELAHVHGLTELDGSRPVAWRSMTEVQDVEKPADFTGHR